MAQRGIRREPPPQPSRPPDMVVAAQEVERFHTRPFPEAEPLHPDPFAAPIVRGLWLGALAGALAGLLAGLLLVNGVVVVPRWEQLFSMGVFTFVVFWTLMGVALGVLLVGVGGLLLWPPSRRERERAQ